MAKGIFSDPEARSAKLKAIWEAKRNGTYVAPEKKPGKRGRPRKEVSEQQNNKEEKIVVAKVEPKEMVFWFENGKRLVSFVEKKEWMPLVDIKSEKEAFNKLTKGFHLPVERANALLKQAKQGSCSISF